MRIVNADQRQTPFLNGRESPTASILRRLNALTDCANLKNQSADMCINWV